MANDDTPAVGGTGEDFAALFAESERGKSGARRRRALHPGDKVRGKIVTIGRETAFLDLEDQRGEGMLDVIELRDATGQLTAAVGDTIEASVAESTRQGGMIVLKRNLGLGAGGRLDLAQAFQHALPVEGTVTAVNKGGVEVDVGGVRAFCPISQLDLRHVEDPLQYVGSKLAFRITRYEEDDRRGPNVVLSRRTLLEEEARGRAAELRASLTVGAILPGVVTALKDYGAFIDLGGIEGMLHVSEIGFQRVGRPADVLTVGQRVSVQVIKIERPTDSRKSEQVALSLKSLEIDPWDSEAARFVEGGRVRGTVTRVTTFGAFVELAPGIEGLAHVSELGAGGGQQQGRISLKPGDAVDVTILSVDRERRRLSLSTNAPDEPLDAEARAVVERNAAPARQGKLGTLGDLFKGVSPGAKR